ncbi:hypothetical protein [Cellulomonas edaphi]|uniref:Uncharacterized protein n=1 Tax=Cellulomonas edaphi TaxID=3053468 RepID=A0ABT7S803_9CELL|nr:hypothetical protein [Cellulomons edaphi]MDM7831654.1 hypothetical protein [Cellulomons edaphi]
MPASAGGLDVAPAWAPIAAEAPAAAGLPDRAAEVDDLDEDDDERKPRHPYTWLHLIVLALVAFVLGFLIMLLVVNNRPDGSAAGDSSGLHVAAATHASPQPA